MTAIIGWQQQAVYFASASTNNFYTIMLFTMRNDLIISEPAPRIAARYSLLTISSPVLTEKGFLPREYTLDGANISPALHIKGLPDGTKSLAILMDDPDWPGEKWVHWLAWNIPPTRRIREGRPMEAEGLNDFRVSHYMGPCHSAEPHHYQFNVYALDRFLDLKANSRPAQFKAAIQGHVLGSGRITVIYRR